VDQAALDNGDGAAPWNHVHRYPADGTFVSVNAGYVYRFAGGAPLYVSNWAAVGGSQPSTLVDQAALDLAAAAPPWNHVQRYPADGTLLTVLAGAVYKVTGGLPSAFPSGNPAAATLIDAAAITNAGSIPPWNHLLPQPTAPGAPSGVSATAGNGQATISFVAPGSNGGSAVSSYTVTSSPGGKTATGSGSPLTVTGLTNGVSYTFTVTATNAVGAGPASAASNAVTPASSTVTPPAATTGSGSSGGGGGGGGGGALVTISITPKSQTVSAGGTATFTVTTMNSGGGYLYGGSTSDGAAPNCNHALETATEPGLLPPNGGSLTFTCTLSGVTSSFTNTITASGLTQNGDTVTASDSAAVTVTGSPSSPAGSSTSGSSTSRAPFTPPRSTNSSRTNHVAFTVTGSKIVHLGGKHPTITLTIALSTPGKVHLTLLDARGKQLAVWTLHEKGGRSTFRLLLPDRAREPGHDRLHITKGDNNKTLALWLIG
jgi:hypothetical protein